MKGYMSRMYPPADQERKLKGHLEFCVDLNAAINILNRELEKIGMDAPEVMPVEIRGLPARATRIAEAGNSL